MPPHRVSSSPARLLASGAARLAPSPPAATRSCSWLAAPRASTRWRVSAVRPGHARWWSRPMSAMSRRWSGSSLKLWRSSAVSTRGELRRGLELRALRGHPVGCLPADRGDNAVGADTRCAIRPSSVPRPGCGVLVNVASLYGRLSSPYVAPYVTSKWGLVGSPRCCARSYGMFRASRCARSCLAWSTPPSTVTPRTTSVVRSDHSPPVTSPERVVAAIVRAVDRPKARIVVGRTQRLGVWAHDLTPRLYDRLVGPVVTSAPYETFRPTPTMETSSNLIPTPTASMTDGVSTTTGASARLPPSPRLRSRRQRLSAARAERELRGCRCRPAGMQQGVADAVGGSEDQVSCGPPVAAQRRTEHSRRHECACADGDWILPG